MRVQANRAAKRDLEALRGMENASVFADEIFGFHSAILVVGYACARFCMFCTYSGIFAWILEAAGAFLSRP